jgi:hypothetical protein
MDTRKKRTGLLFLIGWNEKIVDEDCCLQKDIFLGLQFFVV